MGTKVGYFTDTDIACAHSRNLRNFVNAFKYYPSTHVTRNNSERHTAQMLTIVQQDTLWQGHSEGNRMAVCSSFSARQKTRRTVISHKKKPSSEAYSMVYRQIQVKPPFVIQEESSQHPLRGAPCPFGLCRFLLNDKKTPTLNWPCRFFTRNGRWMLRNHEYLLAQFWPRQRSPVGSMNEKNIWTSAEVLRWLNFKILPDW